MEWRAWLSRAGLGEAQAAEYALLFARASLAAHDVPRLDHASLAAIGVPLAKHRLQILTLARKQSSSSSSPAAAAITVLLPGRATRLLAAAARSLAARLRSAAAAVAPRHPRAPAADRSRGRKTTTKLALVACLSKPMVVLVNGGGKGKKKCTGPTATHAAAVAGCFASTETRSDCDYDANDDEMGSGGECSPETPWESMFQDLNPT